MEDLLKGGYVIFERAERMKGLTVEIFNHMIEMNKKALEAGVDVIQLAFGSPDLSPASHIIETIVEESKNPKNYGYPGSKGIPELLKAISDWYWNEFGVRLDPISEVRSLIGSQEGLVYIAQSLINPGDIALLPDPCFPIFTEGCLIAGAEIHKMPLLSENNYLPCLDSISESVWKRTKLMFLNYPNNPTSVIAPREFFEKVVALAHKYKFLVCHDFAYCHLVFDGGHQESFLSIPGAKEIGIEFNSLSKTYNMCGCRTGYVVGNSNVLSILGRFKSTFDVGIFTPLQKAAIAALTGSQKSIHENKSTYQRRRDIVVDGLKSIGWDVERSQAGLYVWGRVPTKQSSFDFTTDLFKNTGVMITPGSAFGEYGEGHIRVVLVQPEDRIAEAIHRIKKWTS